MRAAAEPTGREVPGAIVDTARDGKLIVRFWGTRGGIARAGHNTARYGGNTVCVTVELDGDRAFVFDAGTGMINFGLFMAARRRSCRFNVFISNPYWDHVQGLPFFEPLQRPGNEIVVHGIAGSELNVRHVMAAQRSNPYVPVAGRERASRIEYREIEEGDYEIDGLHVSAIELNHPGPALGYRVTSPNGKTMVYMTGNEVFPQGTGAAPARERLVSFLKGVDVLIHDATYFDDEYRQHVGCGHSSLSAALTLASEARVKQLYLFHHDPAHDDEAIGKMEMIARYYLEQRRLGIQCWAAREGSAITL